jgi:hypothetical protein
MDDSGESGDVPDSRWNAGGAGSGFTASGCAKGCAIAAAFIVVMFVLLLWLWLQMWSGEPT